MLHETDDLFSSAWPDGPAAPKLVGAAPARALAYPELRYMGSKRRLLPWIHAVLDELDFESALDPFCGTGCVAYLMKAMGRRVTASDFLLFPSIIAAATVGNSSAMLDSGTLGRLLSHAPDDDFIARTFDGVFFTAADRAFLDRVSAGLRALDDPDRRAVGYAALFRSCLKRQPRGVFTVSGDLARYDDGRRDLRLSLEEHFHEQVEAFNAVVFSNGRDCGAMRADALAIDPSDYDLVYLDPPYVPRSDDNCYVKRYHFLEGLASYWKDVELMPQTKVKKIAKRYTPFSYRRTALAAFEALFERFARSTIVLSYSSNGYPDLATLEGLLSRYKSRVTVHERPHRYHFGTHGSVKRASVTEYLIVGR
ncbi:(2Fe-2S)-binding protein [Salinarimonas ramus]|uniref:site-specific DNA-methyltransferase (adenine-specific) n=2 Tax=Salinarimonas ramus TaxID=690164 RepID=A0A917V3A0_9HYPH|nr:(2Fe-2S)-binding protein [Salinarimonas ramus]